MALRNFLPILPYWVLMVLFGTSARMLEPYLSIYATEDLHFDILTVGLLFSVYSVASIIGTVSVAFISLRRTRWIVVVGAVLNSTAFVIFLVTSNVGDIFAARVLQGLSWGLLPTALQIYIASNKVANTSRRDVVSLLTSAPPLSNTLDPAIGGLLIPIGFFLLFVTSFLLSSICVILSFIVLVGLTFRRRLEPLPEEDDPNGKEENRQNPDVERKHVGKLFNREFISLLAGRSLVGYVTGTRAVFFPLFVIALFSFSKPELAILLTLASLVNFACRPLTLKLYQRFKEKQVVRGSYFLYALSTLAYSFTPYVSLVWAGMLASGAADGLYTPTSTVNTLNVIPRRRVNVGMALISLLLSVGQAVGSIVSAYLLVIGNYSWLWGVTIVAALLSLVV